MDYNRDYPEGMSAIDNPQTLLLPDTNRTDWRIGVNYPVGGALVFGICLPYVTNMMKGAPIYTGIWRVPVFGAAGYFALKWAEDWRAEKLSLRDSMYRQYLRDHAEDFQPRERKKVGELLKPWVPAR